jgi:hypothetical protein
VFHSPHPEQRPIHFGDSVPQLWQTNFVFNLANRFILSVSKKDQLRSESAKAGPVLSAYSVAAELT